MGIPRMPLVEMTTAGKEKLKTELSKFGLIK